MRGRHHDFRFEGILKMKLQAFDASALESLQSQNLSRPENRLPVNGLAIVHGRLSKDYPDFIQKLDRYWPRFGEQHQLPFDYEPEKDGGKAL